MRKQIKMYLGTILVFLILVVSLAGCSNKDSSLKDKLASEMEYLDTKIVGMLNKVNGIKLKNYIVNAEKIEQQDTDVSQTGGDQNKDSSQSESNGGKTSSSGSSSSSGEQESQGSGSETSQNNMQFSMEENSILSREKQTDWQGLVTDIEGIYSTWSIIVLDLYKENVDSQAILSFNTDLDKAANAIKEQKKEDTLTALAALYSYIPKYADSYSENGDKIHVYNTKAHLLKAYALLEQNQEEEVKKELQEAEKVYMNLVNHVNENKKNQNTINKAYLLLKDIQNSTGSNDYDVFYVKYKNLVEELNILD